MTDTVSAPAHTDDKPALLDDLRESAETGQHDVAQALRSFRQTVDDAFPEAVQPLRAKIVDGAIELAEKLVAAQYKFNRSLVRSADRALTKSEAHKTGGIEKK